MPHYILIEVEKDGTFFKKEESYIRYFEIYRLSEDHILDTNNSSITVYANNQMEALKKFIKIYGNIYKINDKQYYERVLPIKV
jgi:hypothetical protein